MKKWIAAACAVLAMAAASCSKSNNGYPVTETLPSGVVIETLKPGEGSNPTPESTVSVYYRGTLPDGTVFDEVSSDADPVAFPVGATVPGFAEGLCHMQPGGSYVLEIPAHLAYGEQGVEGVIPANTPLRFEVQLVKIN